MEAHLAWARQWGREVLPAKPETADRTVAALEVQLGSRLPEDFRLYLLNTAPEEEFMDDAAILWWPLDRVRSIVEECGSDTPADQLNPAIDAEQDNYLIFADFLVWCYAWAICCSEGPNRGHIALIGVTPDRFVAESFSEFVALALADSRAIHSG